MRLLEGEWYDFRDLGNLVDELNTWLEDIGAPDWVLYVIDSLIGSVGILLWLVLSVLAFIWIERRVVGADAEPEGTEPGRARRGCCSRWRTRSSCC